MSRRKKRGGKGARNRVTGHARISLVCHRQETKQSWRKERVKVGRNRITREQVGLLACSQSRCDCKNGLIFRQEREEAWRRMKKTQEANQSACRTIQTPCRTVGRTITVIKDAPTRIGYARTIPPVLSHTWEQQLLRGERERKNKKGTCRNKDWAL